MAATWQHAWRIAETASYLVERGYSIVTLQLPDVLLSHATQLAGLLQAECQSRGHAVQLYVLADTTYNSLSVDEVAAQHVGAQCVIHYGRASMTKLSRLPAYFVFPEGQLDVAAAAGSIARSAAVGSAQHAVVFLDQPLIHLLPQVQHQVAAALAERQVGVQLVFAAVPSQHLDPQQPAAPNSAGGGSGAAAGPSCCRSGSGAQTIAQQGQQQPAAATAADAAGDGQTAGACCEAAVASCCQQPTQPSCCGASGEPQAAPPSQGATSAGGRAGSAQGGISSGSLEAGSSSGEAAGESLAGYSWRTPEGVATSDCCLVWVGAEDAPALLQLQMTYNACQWAIYDPQHGSLQEGLPLQTSRALRRRYFLVEKARAANIVGILVGTLGVAGYRGAMQRVRQAAQRAGKKTYTLLMGKPSPAKLANFPEVEVFVMISDPQGQILDCKEYLSPIITPYEAMLAFSPDSEWDERQYRLDFDGVLDGAQDGTPGASQSDEPRFSFVDGSYHAAAEQLAPLDAPGDAGSALALRAQEALQITVAPQGRSDLVEAKSAADYYVHKRTYLGLETPLVEAEEKPVEKAVLGRVGRAAGYRDEPAEQN